MADYTSKIKEISDSLASIEVNIEESEMVQVCLRGLTSKFGAFRTAVCTWENTLSFFDLQSMLLVEENHAGASTSTHTDSKMLGDRPRGCAGRGESVVVCLSGLASTQVSIRDFSKGVVRIGC